ncbi:MAG: exosortase system-associated protein, TIGR04073 family [Candidatus Omnitrophota bacterium]
MKKKCNFRVLLLVVALFSLSWAPFSYAAGPFTKLGRGFANLTTGWLEIFCTAYNQGAGKDNQGIGVLAAVPLGIVKAGIRTIVGVYEVVTFPLSFPNNYEPIVKPEFIQIKERYTVFEKEKIEEAPLETKP